MKDEQDIRKMGGLRRILPFTYTMFLIGSLSLMGFPFLTGFYSKDFILEVSFSSFDETGHFAYWLGTVGAFFTAFYSTRLVFFSFLSETNAHKNVIKDAHDVPFEMGLPLGILAFGSIFVGYLSKDLFIGLGTTFWNNSIFIHPSHNYVVDAEFLYPFFKLLPVILSFGGLFSALYLYFYKFKFLFNLKTSTYGLLFYNFLNRKWFFDKLYTELLNQHVLKVGYTLTYKMYDKGLFELCGPYGLISLFSFLSQIIIKFQTGFIYHYSLMILLGVLFFIIVLLSLVISILCYFIVIIFFFFKKI
jgi:NADH-ubiquinone oxidoreductase chain 5